MLIKKFMFVSILTALIEYNMWNRVDIRITNLK